MKAICIDANYLIGFVSTEGKEYEIIKVSECGTLYELVDDIGKRVSYKSSRFKLISKIREEKLNSLLQKS